MNTAELLIDDHTSFHQAIIKWLNGDMTGHLGAYMYTDDRDDQRWKNGHSAASYYLGRDDKATFEIAVEGLAIKAENFLDLGPGGKDSVRAKSLPILGSGLIEQ
jgi:hypothetical protein